jgi:uncharacterized delta-60 repeat protein
MRHVFTLSFLALSACALAQPAGSLDPSFGTAGKVVTSISSGEDKAYGSALQSDNKILVAGFSTSPVTGKDFTCVRYNANGTLDLTFGTNGIATTDLQLGSDDFAYDIALQADGKIVLAGSSDNGSDKDAALVRYNTDGTLDMSFGTNGVVLTDFDSGDADAIRTVKIHALTGKIVVGGSAQISTNVSKPVVARYLSNGVIDNTFNTTGIRLLWVTSLDYQYLFSVEEIAVQPNGKISAAGWRDFPGQSWSSDYWAGRINEDGTMDATFSTDGVNTYNGGFNGNDKAHAMLLKANNNFLVAGGRYVGTLAYELTMFEVNTSGTLGSWSVSADFDVNPTPDLNDVAFGLAEDVNGLLIGAGSSGTSNSKTFALVRANPGTTGLDATFGTAGKVTTTFGTNTLNECFDVFVQPDNKIVAVGYTGNDFAIARYQGNNTPQLDGFSLLLPADNAVNQNYANLVFDWTDAYGATSYTIEVALDAGFTGSLSTYTVTPSTKTVVNLLPDMQYFWRVKASDGTNSGPYSSVRSFTTNTLENFTLQTPANNAVTQEFASLVLNWTDALGASSYEVEIDSIVTFTDNPQTYTAASSTKTLTSLQPVTDYFWHVRALNGAAAGQWSATWKFRTKAASTAAISEALPTGIVLFPNPSQGEITVLASAGIEGKLYAILDNNGKVLYAGRLNELKTISTSALSSGMYYLSIEGVHQPLKFIHE